MEARDSFCFPKKTKNPNPSPIGKKFGFCCCGAPPGTRTLGPLIKRASRRFVSIYGSFELSSFLNKVPLFYTQQFLHPLSDFAVKIPLCTFWNRAKSVQKPCTYSLTNKNRSIPYRLDGIGLSGRASKLSLERRSLSSIHSINTPIARRHCCLAIGCFFSIL